MEVNTLLKQLNRYRSVVFLAIRIALVFIYIGLITPSSQESGNTPMSKIKFKNVTYNGIILCAVALIYSSLVVCSCFDISSLDVCSCFDIFIIRCVQLL